MFNIILTQNHTFIIGPVAKILGYLMEGIFWFLGLFGDYPNIGAAIIIFTVIVYLCLLPLTIKQQKFSKMSAKMNPEIQAIQAKYKGKKDQESMQALQDETNAVYAKYGVSPAGSCLQLLIQMPILFALYRVIYSIPAYVAQVKDAFFPLVTNLRAQAGSVEFIQTLEGAKNVANQFKKDDFINDTAGYVTNTFIDVLNKCSEADWNAIIAKYPSLADNVHSTMDSLSKFNNFLGLNIGYSPLDTIFGELGINSISEFTHISFANANIWVLVLAVSIPVLSAVTQWINVKLTPQQQNNSNSAEENPMASSMKMMNFMMPLMSAFFCFTLPAGMGLYWVAGAVIRGIQQVVINKYIDSMDIDAMIEKNMAKYQEKLKKRGNFAQGINKYANQNTKNANTYSNKSFKPEPRKVSDADKEKAKAYLEKQQAKDNKKGSSSGKSIAQRANMVKDYNERNSK